MLRVAIAMLAAPVAVWAVLFAFALRFDPDPVDSGLVYFGLVVGVALVSIGVLVGVPLLVVLRRYRRAGLWPYVVAGALTGLAMLVLFGGGFAGFAASVRHFPIAPLGYALVGAAIGVVFWWMGIRRNPWFVSGESWLEDAALRAAAASNANAYAAGRSVGRIFSAMERTFDSLTARARSRAAPHARAWAATPGRPPVLGVCSLLIPVGLALVWAGLQKVDLRPLGYAVMLVYALLTVLAASGVIAGICLALASLVRRERFWPLALAGLLTNLAVVVHFRS